MEENGLVYWQLAAEYFTEASLANKNFNVALNAIDTQLCAGWHYLVKHGIGHFNVSRCYFPISVCHSSI